MWLLPLLLFHSSVYAVRLDHASIRLMMDEEMVDKLGSTPPVTAQQRKPGASDEAAFHAAAVKAGSVEDTGSKKPAATRSPEAFQDKLSTPAATTDEKANASANGSWENNFWDDSSGLADDSTHLEVDASLAANVSENGTSDNWSDTVDNFSWMNSTFLDDAIVSAAQISDELRTAANGTDTTVPVAPADLRRSATAELGIVAGRCGLNMQGGGYIGCNLGCACGWGSRCYKSSMAVDGGAVDVGVCEASTSVLVMASLLLFTSCFGTVMSVRLMLLKGDLQQEPPFPLKAHLLKSQAASSSGRRPGVRLASGSEGEGLEAGSEDGSASASDSGSDDASSDYDVVSSRQASAWESPRPDADSTTPALTSSPSLPAASSTHLESDVKSAQAAQDGASQPRISKPFFSIDDDGRDLQVAQRSSIALSYDALDGGMEVMSHTTTRLRGSTSATYNVARCTGGDGVSQFEHMACTIASECVDANAESLCPIACREPI